MDSADFYLYINRVQVQGANAVSSPLTYGTPAITGFFGNVHALERKIPFEVDLRFDGVLIASHECRVKRYRKNSYSDYTLNQTRNPIKKNGKTAAIIEEGKLDMTVSLVIPVRGKADEDLDWLEANQQMFIEWAQQTLYQQRMAGGSVFAIASVELIAAEDLDQLKARLAPAFILMDARQELIDITRELQQQTPDATALDALLEVATLRHTPELKMSEKEDEKKEPELNYVWKTTNAKQGRGWLVPMPVGYQAISPLHDPETLQNSRAPQYPSQFVETLYSLGKWVFPYSLTSLETAFWRANTGENGLYLLEQINN